MRHALQTLQRMGAPYLQWTGKAERTAFVDGALAALGAAE